MSASQHTFGHIKPGELSEHALAAQERHRAVVAEYLRRIGVIPAEEEVAQVIPISTVVGASALSSAVEAPYLSLTA